MSESHGPGPAGDAGPHVFVESLDSPVLAPDDEHHLRRVLRLRDGDAITISDGHGKWRPARFGSAPEVSGEVVVVDRPLPHITVGFVVPKGDRPAWIIQKLTELGVDRIMLLSSARSVVRWDADRADKHVTRLRSVARSAAMQSRQVRLPHIEPMRPVLSALADGSAAIAHRDGAPPSLSQPTVLVGPEGGWDSTELATGSRRVALGSSVLRADTAAVVAGASLQLLRCGLVSERSA